MRLYIILPNGLSDAGTLVPSGPLPSGVGGSGEVFRAQRAFAASRAEALRSSAVSFFALAAPPRRPISAAVRISTAGFVGELFAMSQPFLAKCVATRKENRTPVWKSPILASDFPATTLITLITVLRLITVTIPIKDPDHFELQKYLRHLGL